jgi:2-polyprenyl-6-methoxyphenol hydroxylase-like FAD-dependent oxidoreductase
MAAIFDPSRHAAADPARRAATERLGPENILTSHHLSGWTETPHGVRADFIDKATGKCAGRHDGALLIAADGIHSAIREKLYPREGPPIWNGRILWRGITAGDAFLSGRTMIMAARPHPEELAKQASRRMDATHGLAAILRDARKGALLREPDRKRKLSDFSLL